MVIIVLKMHVLQMTDALGMDPMVRAVLAQAQVLYGQIMYFFSNVLHLYITIHNILVFFTLTCLLTSRTLHDSAPQCLKLILLGHTHNSDVVRYFRTSPLLPRNDKSSLQCMPYMWDISGPLEY